jgi:very-short-patch-repair endonuclease
VFGADGTKIAIECDGDYWHGDDQFEQDMQRQEILERAGWQLIGKD